MRHIGIPEFTIPSPGVDGSLPRRPRLAASWIFRFLLYAEGNYLRRFATRSLFRNWGNAEDVVIEYRLCVESLAAALPTRHSLDVGPAEVRRAA